MSRIATPFCKDMLLCSWQRQAQAMVWLSAQTLCPRQTSQNVEERQRKAQGLKGFNPVNGSEWGKCWKRQARWQKRWELVEEDCRRTFQEEWLEQSNDMWTSIYTNVKHCIKKKITPSPHVNWQTLYWSEPLKNGILGVWETDPWKHHLGTQ